jgi:predicted nucleic acid-binding protein
MRFFDASALVKKYVRESDSARVRRLLRSGEVALCRLSEVEVARRLLMQHQLRAGDAVQLSAALVLQVGLGEALEQFVAYDHRILGVADAEQLAVRMK